MSSKRTVGIAVAALVGVNALWGMSFPIMKAMNEIIDSNLTPGQSFQNWPIPCQVASSSFMIASRFLLASIFLGLLLSKLFRFASRAEWMAGFWIGIVFCLGLILQVIGLASIPASRSGFLTSLTAVYTPLMASFLLRKPPSLNVWFGIGLALTGVLILSDVISIGTLEERSGQSMRVPLNWGDVWTTLGALFFSVQVILIDWYGKRHRSAYVTPGMFLTTVMVASLTFLLTANSFKTYDVSTIGHLSFFQLYGVPSYLVALVVLAFFCSLLSFLGMNTYQPYVSASQASVVYSTEPLFASLWAMVIPGWIGAYISIHYGNEEMSRELVVGGILVMIANVVALWPQSSIDTEPVA